MKLKRLDVPNAFVIRDFVTDHDAFFHTLKKNIPWNTIYWEPIKRNLPRKGCSQDQVPSFIHGELLKLLQTTIYEINRHRGIISSTLKKIEMKKYSFFCNYKN